MADLEQMVAGDVQAFLDELSQLERKKPGTQEHEHHHPAPTSSYSRHCKGHSQGGHSHHTGGSMAMWFHGGYHETILLQMWQISSFQELVWSCLMLFTLGIAYEGMKWMRLRLSSQRTQGGGRSATPTKPAISHKQLLDFILYSLQLSLAYALMLVVMTYNVWLSLAVILGAAVGNSLFSRLAAPEHGESLTSDACH